MNQPKEANWTEILRPAPFTIRPSNSRKCTCGGKNCQTAKKIKCTCRCHSENHGAANREGMPKLDKLLHLDGLEIEAPAPLGLEWPFDEK
jgi:hypothetical protein